jgi:hypothetical protein
MQNDTPALGDFIVGPARVILSMKPGEERTVEIQLTNREGRLAAFDLSTEDFAADDSPEGTPVFYADGEEGPFPASTWIVPQIKRIELAHAERAFIPVTVKVPRDADPGDHQAALMFIRDTKSQPIGGFNIVSRVASLFIISVQGDVVKDATVDSLWSRYYFNWFYPVFLEMTAHNKGTIHMMPKGTIDIRNMFGITVDQIPVENWVILRESSRARTFEWRPKFAMGYYKAVTNLTGFDEQPLTPIAATFWMIPLLPVLIVLFCIFVVSFVVQYFFSRFEIKRKGDEETPEAKK